MLDVDTFLTTLYVMADDFCQSHPQKGPHPGPDASLSPGEVITLAIFARWSRFTSERDSYRYASSRLRDAFPTLLPDRSQLDRLVRHYLDLIEEMALPLANVMKAQEGPYESPDSSAMLVRDAKRRGEGWLAGQADIGWSNRLGWYEGFRLLVATDPTGVVTRSSASVSLRPPTGRRPRPSSPSGIDRTLGCPAWDRRPPDPT